MTDNLDPLFVNRRRSAAVAADPDLERDLASQRAYNEIWTFPDPDRGVVVRYGIDQGGARATRLSDVPLAAIDDAIMNRLGQAVETMNAPLREGAARTPGATFDPGAGVVPEPGGLPLPSGERLPPNEPELRAGPPPGLRDLVADRLGRRAGKLVKTDLGDFGLLDLVPGVDVGLAMEDVRDILARERFGDDVGGGEKAGTYLAVPLSVFALGGAVRHAGKGLDAGLDAAEAALKGTRAEPGKGVSTAADEILDLYRGLRDAEDAGGSGFNLERLDTTAAVKAEIASAAKAYKTRGKVPHEVTAQLADLLGADQGAVGRIVGEFAGGATEGLHARALVMRRLLVQSGERMDTLARQVAERGTDDDMVAFREHLARHAALQNTLKGVQTDIARALSAFRITAGAPKDVQVDALIRELGGRDETKDLARRYLELDTAAARNQFVRKSWAATTKDVFFETWINGLLSSPKTHVVNITSNALFTLWQVPERALAAGVGLLHGGERVALREAADMLHGLVEGTGDGLRLAWRSFQTDTPSDAIGKLEHMRRRAITADTFRASGWVGQGIDFLGTVVRLPGRALLAEDEFFKAVAYRMELRALARRKAMVAHQGGASETDAARVYAAVLDGADEGARAAATDAAHVATFTRELDSVGRKVQALAGVAPFRVLMPFVRTPGNIIKEFGKRSPFALAMPKGFWAEVAAGGARRDLALAKVGFGSAIMAWAGSLAMDGRITGGGPGNPKLRAQLRETGWQPYSIVFDVGQVPDNVLAPLRAAGLVSQSGGLVYIAYGRLEPLAILFGTVADAVDFNRFSDNGEDRDLVAAHALGAVLENLGSKTFLHGLSMAAAAYADPGQFAPRFVQRLAGSMMPYSALVANVEATLDPEARDATPDPNLPFALREFHRVLNALQARIPVWSDGLPMRRNIWGDRVTYNTGEWWEFLNPFYVSRGKHAPVDDELVRLGYPLSMPRRQVSGVDLTPDQYWRLVELQGQGIRLSQEPGGPALNQRHAMLLTVRSETYRRLGDLDRIEALRAMHRGYLAAARARLLNEDPELRRKVELAIQLRAAGIQ